MARRGTNIYKRKDGRWEARFVKTVGADGRKKYASVYGRTYREAREKQEYCRQNVHLKAPPGTEVTLSELMWCWLSHAESTLKHSSYIKYESMIRNHFSDGIGNIPAKYITGSMIDRFVGEKLEGETRLSAKSVNDLLIIVGQAFTYGEQEYGLVKPTLHRVKETQGNMRVLSRAEQQTLEHYLLSDMDSCKLGVLLALYTGVRIGELCALRWEDISGGVLTVNKTMHRIKSGGATIVECTSPKTPASNRRIPVPGSMLTLLEQFRGEGNVLQTRRGSPVEPRLLQMKFQRYAAACGLEKVNFHALRHTFATRCIETGFDVKSLSEILGHTDVKTTLNRYVHPSEELKRANMDRLALQLHC